MKAVIFDLDGTILDNERVYGEVFRKTLAGYGIDVPNHKLAQTSGIGVKENWVILKERYDLPPSADELTEKTEKLYLSRLDKVKIRPGFLKLVQALKEKGIKVLLATSASKDTLAKVFQHFSELKMGKIFAQIITGDDVKKKKPDPELFLKSCQKQNLSPHDCLVLEDSPSGAEAARGAGMEVIILAYPWFAATDFGGAPIASDFFEVKDLLKLS